LIGQIYGYVVCLALLLALITATVIGVTGVFKLVSPKQAMSEYEYSAYQRAIREDTCSASESGRFSEVSGDSVPVGGSLAIPAEPDAPRKKAASEFFMAQTAAEMLDAKRHEGIRDIINMVVVWIICLPVFWVHFRWVRKLAEQEAAARIMRRRYPGPRQARRHNSKPNSKSG